ncbi:ATP-binding protein [Streptomyces sp. RKAG293]|uniref:ATP-binding protein n=1 Tax=Streptomyces sp. RKAG293 TaxID=2893403 RepID=UPI0020342D6A|nr:ATP-binding protein [Streptomyces sp. RKAG293]MCM2417905.1 ATP-binding protein [Streptomyces sp. RKAG293]
MPEPVIQRFHRTPRAVPEARLFVQQTLAAWGISGDADAVLLCVSELATNAIRHGVPAGGHFIVKVARNDDCLRVEVGDMNRCRPRLRHPSADDVSGRGLLLIANLADSWGVVPRAPSGKVVWTEFKIPGVHPGRVLLRRTRTDHLYRRHATKPGEAPA